MSNYKNFIKDFPTRCCRLLERYYDTAQASDLEVTLMLSIATSGLTIPKERLSSASHPSKDTAKFTKAKKALEKLNKKRFIGSRLWNDDLASWRYVEEMGSISENPENWQPQWQDVTELTKSNYTILRHLRNALAHGNIFTRGHPIQEIIFLIRLDPPEEHRISFNGSLIFKMTAPGGQPSNIEVQDLNFQIPPQSPHKYALLSVSPSDFCKFLKNWFNFLKGLDLPDEVINEVDNEA